MAIDPRKMKNYKIQKDQSIQCDLIDLSLQEYTKMLKTIESLEKMNRRVKNQIKNENYNL